MGYANPLLRRTWSAATRALSQAGVDALLVADLPVEEGHAIADAAPRRFVPDLFASLIERRGIAPPRASRGFLYTILRTGVTGAASVFDASPSSSSPAVRSPATCLPSVSDPRCGASRAHVREPAGIVRRAGRHAAPRRRSCSSRAAPSPSSTRTSAVNRLRNQLRHPTALLPCSTSARACCANSSPRTLARFVARCARPRSTTCARRRRSMPGACRFFSAVDRACDVDGRSEP